MDDTTQEAELFWENHYASGPTWGEWVGGGRVNALLAETAGSRPRPGPGLRHRR